jgi:hypothetical protein
MKDDPSPWEKRWRVSITCRDCGEEWECNGVSASTEMVAGFNRIFVAGGPEVCPECKNMKLASPPQPQPAEESDQGEEA